MRLLAEHLQAPGCCQLCADALACLQPGSLPMAFTAHLLQLLEGSDLGARMPELARLGAKCTEHTTQVCCQWMCTRHMPLTTVQ
jgi:hypothetical protein